MTLLIAGASTRSAAFSALRAGLSPVCIDLFADRDLAAACPVTEIPPGGYPDAIADIADTLPPGPWMYTGAIENYPDLVARISERRELWGNVAAALRKVRDPFALANALIVAGLPALDVRRSDDTLPPGRWLAKPRAGAGGGGIRFAGCEPSRAGTYLQRYIDGVPHAAIYVADAGGVRLVGVTRMLVGRDWLHAPPFRYCGSVGPVEADDGWQRLGEVVAAFAGLHGVFGIDAVVADGVPWLVEVNPRYTASVEVLEYATGASVFGSRRFAEASNASAKRREPEALAKAIYYAPADIAFPAAGPWDDDIGAPPDRLPRYADVPWSGERIAAGRPVMSLFAADEAGLRAAAADLDRRLFP
ncbi:MAG: ATP-grasp domain-containing protein [Gemmataceae bacterium]